MLSGLCSSILNVVVMGLCLCLFMCHAVLFVFVLIYVPRCTVCVCANLCAMLYSLCLC